ncbi:MAG: Unknown protein [uncultured Sulfurovum sp.]|uniref:Uncharacterized protein n=1 Tax=uncultured Sulfurovum sp. TaxID=269237 RepID=A0A6S6SQL7_9BACT|nr:MAG: Unknown protein [uncultured Sulfurovum sp.]
MKKILIVSILLALIIFSLYHKDVDTLSISKKGYFEEICEAKIEQKSLKIFNTSKDELISDNEQNETEEKVFSVKIMGDLNITRDTLVKLSAEVKNATALDKCNYWWYEDTKLISIGAVLEETFSKGQHKITLVIRDANGVEKSDTVVLEAFDYFSIKRSNYDAYYGSLLYVERQIMNHKGQYMLYDDGIYLKEYSSYDEAGNLVEKTVEYYTRPNENSKTLYTYDNQGNRLTEETFNADGEMVYFVINTYDDTGILIRTQRGGDEESLVEENYTDVKDSNNSYAKTEEIVLKDSRPKDIIRINDNGQVVYEERHYPGGHKSVNEMSYNSDGQLTRTVKNITSPYDLRLDISDYDKNGNIIKKEIKYQLKDELIPCHYINESTYINIGQIKSSANTILEGECPYIDEIKQTFTYNMEGDVLKVNANSDGSFGKGLKTLEVLRTYTNELDI